MDLSKYTQQDLEKLQKQLNLTFEEEKVLNELVNHKSRQEIAITLKMSIRTVDRRIESIKKKIKREDNKIPLWEKINLTVDEAAEYSNIGTSTIRKLTKSPNCNFALWIGDGKLLIKRKEFEKYCSSISEI